MDIFSILISIYGTEGFCFIMKFVFGFYSPSKTQNLQIFHVNIDENNKRLKMKRIGN